MKKMGRSRSNASQLEDNANMLSGVNPLERDSSQPDTIDQSSEGTNLGPNVASPKKRKMKQKIVRRSQRIQNTASFARSGNQTVTEPVDVTVIEEQDEDETSGHEEEKLPEPAQNDQTMGNLYEHSVFGHGVLKTPEPVRNVQTLEDEEVEGEDEDEPSDHEEEKLPEPGQNDKAMEEKIDYLIKLVEAQEKTIEALKAKVEVTCRMSDKSLSTPDARYKSMYFDSQKKIEALTDENRQMALKLEKSLGKLEVYEKGGYGHSDLLEKLKDFILVSNLSKFAGAGLNAQALPSGGDAPNNEPKTTAANKKRKGGGK